jgi:hypothetical protein
MRALALVVSASMAPSAVAESCPAPDQIHVDGVDKAFSQERTLNGVDHPLKSSGRLKVTKDQIDWHMTEPFEVDTAITPQGITQSVDGGAPQPAGDVAGLGPQIAKLLAGLMQGRWTELESLFQVEKKPGEAGKPWAVSLDTIDPMLKKAVSRIDVQGCTDVTAIDIQHPNGDHERITFGDRSTAP